jgi:predicted dehydrogenase
MIDEIDLDLVAIATDSGSHAQIALDCMDKNIHLIIEKPIALSLKDADSIITKAKQKNLVVSPSHQNRFNKSIQKVKQALDENKFGKLFHGTAHVRWNRGQDYYSQDSWRGTWEYDGGALMNQCIHNIDLLRWLMGDEISEVYGVTSNLNHPYLETEDLGLGIIKFKNGSFGVIEGTNNVYPKNLEETLYIFGEKGTFKAGGKSVNIIEEWEIKDSDENSEDVKSLYSEYPPNVYGFGHTPFYKDVINSIQDGKQPYITALDGRNALELVLSIYLSSKLGKPISFPLDSISTNDFK